MNTTINTNEITMRQFFEAVVEGKVTPSIIEKAKENLPIKQAIFEYLVANGTKTTAEIAKGVEVLEGSAPKASAMCRQMVDEGRLTSSDVPVKGKGKQKAYTAIVPAE